MRFILFSSFFVLHFVSLYSQTTLGTGDLQFLSFRSDAPDAFSFVIWQPLEDSTRIGFTDNGWAAGDINSFSHQTESSIYWTYRGQRPLKAGTVISISCFQANCSASVGVVSGYLGGLSTSGDQIFAFQGSLDSVHFLAAINFDGLGWAGDRLDPNTSALPSSLVNDAIHLDEIDNAHFAGIRNNHRIDEYKNWISDTDNGWLSYNSGSIHMNADTSSFEIVPEPSAPLWRIDSLIISSQGVSQLNIIWIWPKWNRLERGRPGLLVSIRDGPNNFAPSDSVQYQIDSDLSDGFALDFIDTARSSYSIQIPNSTASYSIKIFSFMEYNNASLFGQSALLDTNWSMSVLNELSQLQMNSIVAGGWPTAKRRVSEIKWKWWVDGDQLFWQGAEAAWQWQYVDPHGRSTLGKLQSAEGSMQLPVGGTWGFIRWWKKGGEGEWIAVGEGKVLH
jgi:hypothetical protein